MPNFNRIRQAAPMYPTTLPWAVQKRLNRSICCYGLWTREGRRKHKFNSIHQMGGHIGAIWRIRLNRLCVAAMRSC